MKKNFEVFFERLRQCQNGMNVSAFARFLGVNQKTLDLYIKGQRKPSVGLVYAVCSKCGVTADWLLGLTDSPHQGAAPIKIVEKDPHLGISRTRGYVIARKTATGYPERVAVTEIHTKDLEAMVDKCVVRRLAAERKAKSPRHYLRTAKKATVILPSE